MSGSLKLGQMLLQQGLLDPAALESALAEQASCGGRLGGILVRLGYLSERNLVRVLAEQLRVPVARIGAKRVNPEVLGYIPGELAEKYRCLPLFFKREGSQRHLFVALEDPGDREALDELAFQVGEKLMPVLIGPSQLDEALEAHYRQPQPFRYSDPGLTASSLAATTEPGITAPSPPEPASSQTLDMTPAPAASQTLVTADPPPTSSQTAPITGPASGSSQTAPTEPTTPPGFEGRGDVTQPDLHRSGPSGPPTDGSANDSDTQPQLPPVDPLLHPAPGAAAPSLSELLGHDTTPHFDASLLRPQGSAPDQGLEGAESALLLRTLTELLIEKGVLSREEIMERLRRVTGPKPGR